MKSMKALVVAVAAVLGTAQLAGCASEPTSRSTGRVLDDVALTAKVKTALARDDEVAAHNVNVTTYRGLVQLSGFVENEQVAHKAAELARNVDGVSDVYNDLRVISPASSAAGR